MHENGKSGLTGRANGKKSGGDPVDIAELSDILGTADRSVICRILEVWLEASPSRMEAISRAVEAKDRTMLRQAVHGAKGTALQVGAKKLADMCARMDADSSSASWDILFCLAGEIFDENKRARHFVKKFIDITI